MLLGVGLQVPDSVGHHNLVRCIEVLVLPCLSEDFDHLVHSALSVLSKENIGFLNNDLTEEFVLLLALFSVVSDRQKGNPVAHELVVDGSI